MGSTKMSNQKVEFTTITVVLYEIVLIPAGSKALSKH